MNRFVFTEIPNNYDMLASTDTIRVGDIYYYSKRMVYKVMKGDEFVGKLQSDYDCKHTFYRRVRGMKRIDMDDLLADVDKILREELDEEVLRDWGGQVNEWVRDAVNEGDTDAKSIAKGIIEDYQNSH